MSFIQNLLTLTLLTWRIWWASNNASRWQMGFNSVFKGLNQFRKILKISDITFKVVVRISDLCQCSGHYSAFSHKNCK